MKRLILVFFLFSGLMAKSQCDTMTSATFTAITTNSVNVSFTVSGGNWSSFSVALYDTVTGAIPVIGFELNSITTTTFVATGLRNGRVYGLRVYTNRPFGGGCEPSTLFPTFKTLGATLAYTPMLANGYSYKRISVDSTFHLPLQDTSLNRGLTRAGALVIRPQDSSFYGWNGRKWAELGGKVDSSKFASVFKVRQDSTTLAAATNTKPSYGDVRQVVSDSIAGKVSKWERWTDTFFIQKYDTNKTALTIRVDSNLTSKPTFQIIDSINRPLFEMRSGNKRFEAENMFFGIGSGQKLRPIKFNSGTYGLITGGSLNTAFGDHALESAVDANENAAFGTYALQNLIGGNGGDPLLDGALNTALGAWAGRGMTIGIANTLIGQKAGNSITTGGYNVMGGKSVGEGVTIGGWNVLFGSETGKFMASNAVFNTWIGTGAGKNNTGSYSILLGAGSGSRYATDKELVAGDSTITPINDLWFGKGKFSASPTAYTIHGTRGWGTDRTGGNINIAAGEGTGFAGFSGRINFQISKPAGATTQQHFLMNAMIVASNPIGNGGNIGINKEPTNTLDVINTQTNRQATDTLASFSTLGASYQTFGTTMRNITLHADARATNVSGTGSLRNVGLYATASRGDLNYAAILDSGNVGIGIIDPTFKLDVNGVSNFRSRLFTTSLDLNKDSVAFATAASKIMLIDTVTGLATRANIGTGLSLTSGTLSATTSVFGGTISASVTAATTFIVTIPTQANNTYQVSVQGGNMVSVGGFVANKTTTSFDYIVPAAITGTVQFDWILKP